MSCKEVNVRKLVGREQLVGALMGESDLRKFETAASEVADANCLSFDWTGISVATGSYLQAAFVPVLLRCRCVVICRSLERPVEEDMEIVLSKQNIATWIVRKRSARNADQLQLLGPLENVYRETLELIKERSTVTSGELFTLVPNVGKTAWINRLNKLSEMRLIFKKKVGREYQYSIPR